MLDLDVTDLLLAWRGGDEEALSRLIPVIERELDRLVDSARAKRYQKRGGGEIRVTFDEGLPVAGDAPPDLVSLDEAL